MKITKKGNYITIGDQMGIMNQDEQLVDRL